MMPQNEASVLTVTDIKQWGYCKRVVYYERCLPAIRPTTYHMKHGRRAHEAQSRHAVRRVLPVEDVAQGVREFGVRYYSPELGLSGILDELIRAEDGRIIPVDYKTTDGVAHNHKLQLAAYALLIEAIEGVVVDVGYIYLIPKRKMTRVPLTQELKQAVRDTIHDVLTLIDQEWMPPPAPNLSHCVGCEFKRFCNDVE